MAAPPAASRASALPPLPRKPAIIMSELPHDLRSAPRPREALVMKSGARVIRVEYTHTIRSDRAVRDHHGPRSGVMQEIALFSIFPWSDSNP